VPQSRVTGELPVTVTVVTVRRRSDPRGVFPSPLTSRGSIIVEKPAGMRA